MSQCNLLEVESRISSESIWKYIVFQEKYYSVFSVFGLNTSSARIRKNTDQKKLLFEHFYSKMKFLHSYSNLNSITSKTGKLAARNT